ncbi:radical SAM protein [Serratia sp. DD3]|uniref:radical SAM/SPASM domain-containing protein n=1 Tax=Serratia sp. DD3 TaxID=1410619 RepID=UPI0004DA6C53|nr:radical SAM protein [Serratia sp. DD3]KEY56451.1 antilisterial bacteriocin subtilosin biosynthesis protein AlbA [Serratia sp. DD3]KEY59382.1 antilisterial bacteriocin subtilosin biosynthesis protein AlbA [Serratia sp. DD3]
MFLKKKSNIIFREYDSFGYITDNRNFGYKKTNANERYIGDKILSKSGAIFFSVLNIKPQPFDEIVEKIINKFTGADADIIKNDSEEFYSMLEIDGFIVSGKTPHECEEKDKGFSYKDVEQEKVGKILSPTIAYPEKSTQNFLEEHFGGKPQLTSLHIEITSKCNERCIHCYIPHEYKINNISPVLFYDILEQCKKMKVLHLTLSGGEPMLHKNFCDFLKACREGEFSVNILSNLTFLNSEILKEMKSNPLLGVQVSLYSMNPDIHDEITKRKGSFEKTKRAILNLIENDIPLQISCPIMKQNKNYYNDVVEWADKYNIHAGSDYVIIAKYNNSINNLNCRLSINEVKEVISYKLKHNPDYIKKTEAENNIMESDSVCSVCNSSICIADNGNVYPCAGWQNYIVGNVKDDTLSDIWYKSDKIRYLRGIRKHDFPKCVQCSDKDYCTMCMVRNANENPHGDPLSINEYYCDIAKANKEIALNKK